ncbi:MAG: hypothetical protein ACUVX8_11815 [Candidatus Zipacnadales bacterium]
MDRRQFGQLLAVSLGTGLLKFVQAQDGDGAMRRYVERIYNDLRRVHTEQLETIEKAGERIAERVATGGRLLIYDLRGEYSAEAIGRAGGLMAIQRLEPQQAYEAKAADALLIVADEPANNTDLAVAQVARRGGALVVGICPVRPGTPALSGACDLALDNYVTDEDAAIRIPGLEKAIAPTSGVLNTAVLWALTAAYIGAMERRGKAPHVWMSIKRPGATTFNKEMQQSTLEAGY